MSTSERVLYILEDGNTINSISDLTGTTLYATGQGSTPEYILRYVLEKNGIDPDSDLTIEYLSEHSELATLMTSGDVALGMLPEPNVTAALLGNSNLRISLDLTEEWKKVDYENRMMWKIRLFDENDPLTSLYIYIDSNSGEIIGAGQASD